MSSKGKSTRSTTNRSVARTSNLGPARVRKAFSPDLNLSSYDRTDPFTALNTLLKLLTSLPSRIGGCQYKFSPEEHKLSVHLLNIVEPFVGLAPSRKTITRQPTEILDAIAFHVDSPADLMSLGLSCKRMHNIVIPRHLHFREIRCKLSSIRVWHHLSTHRQLAKNVRRLVVLDERSGEQEMLPPGMLVSDTDLESTDDELGIHAKHERFMVAALARMSALSSFAWSCNHTPVEVDALWPVLRKCRTLQHVQICDNVIFSTAGDGDDTAPEGEDGPTMSSPSVTSTSTCAKERPVATNLRSMVLRSTKHSYGSVTHPSLARVKTLLSECPSLETLEISYIPAKLSSNPHPSIDELLLVARFPSLTHLYLHGLRYSSSSPVSSPTSTSSLSVFLASHSNLRVLHLDISGPGIGQSNHLPSFTLPDNSLPALHEIKASRAIVNAVLTCPISSTSSSTSRPLTIVKNVRLTNLSSPHEATFLSNLRLHSHSIKRLELSHFVDLEDIRRICVNVPGLTWLEVARNARSGGPPTKSSDRLSISSSSVPVVNAMEWANALSLAPELHAVHGVRFFYEVASMPNSSSSLPSNSNSGASAGVGGTASSISLADRSRMRKNDEIASILAWKCPKLRRVDYWDTHGHGPCKDNIQERERKIIVLLRDEEKVRWEVRRVKI